MPPLNIEIDEEFHEFIAQRVSNGAHESADAYVNSLIRDDQTRDRMLRLMQVARRAMPMIPARARPRTRDEIAELVRAHFPEDTDTIEQTLLPAITFVEAPRADGRIALRLGGRAPLPADREWPVNGDRELVFVAAVDLTVVGPHDVTGALPTSGSLLFFYDIVSQSWGLDPEDSAPWRVVYLGEDEASAPERSRRPHDTDRQYLSRPHIDRSEVHDAAPTWTMPLTCEPCVRDTTYGSAHGDAYRSRRKDFGAIEDAHSMSFQMLGWPYYNQPNSRQWSVEVDSSGRSWDEVTEADVADWRLLMQFPKWDESGGTLWGGTLGWLQYWIRDGDLRAGNFDRVWIQVDAAG